MKMDTHRNSADQRHRILALDMLRAIAIFLVIVYHMQFRPDAPQVLLTLERGGWVGVDIFFVLSGFLVSGLLFHEYQQSGRVNVGRFLIRRGFKIYPAYYAFLGLNLALVVPCGSPVPSSRLIWAQLLFVQNYFRRYSLWDGAWGHTWTLAVEEHFYILAALAIAYLFRRSMIHSLPTGIGVILFASLVLRLTAPTFSTPGLRCLSLTHYRLDSLSFGVLLAYYWHFHRAALKSRIGPFRWILILLGFVLLAPAFVFSVETTPGIEKWGVSMFYIGSGCILVGSLLCQVLLSPLTRLLGFIGVHSYSIYLWHMVVLTWVLPVMQTILHWSMPAGTRLLMAIVLSCIVGIVFARVIEFPALRIRDRFFPSNRSRAEAAAKAMPSPRLITTALVMDQ